MLASVAHGSTASITSSESGDSRIGRPVTWTVNNYGQSGGTTLFRYQVTTADGTPMVWTDYSSSSSFTWIPRVAGAYSLTATIKHVETGQLETELSSLNVNAESSSITPRIEATNNPLVAVYVGGCDVRANGSKMRVLFYPSSGTLADAQATPFSACTGKATPFVVGGMRPQTQYTLRSQVLTGRSAVVGDGFQFTTGAIPEDVAITPFQLRPGQPGAASLNERFILESYLAPTALAVAFERTGTPVWYYRDPALANIYLIRPLPGGSMFMMASSGQAFREIDLAGNILHEISVQGASDQLRTMKLAPIMGFNHDAVRLPNGYTAVIVNVEQLADQGSGLADVDGDGIVVLDRNWNVVWMWNPFQKLDVKRAAILGEQCGGTCATLAQVANDWTHANSLMYTQDGNLLLSMRHQDWVIKIDYRDGKGSGDVIWRLGLGGDFSAISTDPYPWFSHQHYATLTNNEFVVFDNGNTRIARYRGSGNSRGQVWILDEKSKTATLKLNVDLGRYSFALGSAEKLSNGNYEFLAGDIQGATGFTSEATEVSPDPLPAGKILNTIFANAVTYRTFRLVDLYSPQ